MIVISLSHRTAPIDIRERMAIPGEEIGSVLETIGAMPEVSEAVLLSTCNRVEIYAEPSTADEAALERRLTAWVDERGGRAVTPYLTAYRGSEAVLHLFRVAASLDSLVVGEPQILGQLKDAIATAREAGTVGKRLELTTGAAVKVAKKVRTQTAIGSGQVSVPSVAVQLAQQIFDELSGHRALLVGAGDMAESAARLVARAGAELTVLNRSADRAEALAGRVGGQPAHWDELDARLVEADIAITSTASRRPIVTKKQLKSLRRRRKGRSLFVIDIAVPRDVDPAANDVDYVYLYDIDDLSHVVAESLEERRGEAERAQAIVRHEAQQFEERRTQQSMKPVIVALRERTRATLTAELERSCKQRLKHLPEEDREALSVMIDAAVNKLLHAPTKRLRQLATSARSEEAASLVSELFELEPRTEEAPDEEDDTRNEPSEDERPSHGAPAR